MNEPGRFLHIGCGELHTVNFSSEVVHTLEGFNTCKNYERDLNFMK